MIKTLLLGLLLLVLGFHTDNPNSYITLEISDYRIYTSVFTFFALICFIILGLQICILPFKFIKFLKHHHKKVYEMRRHDIMRQVLLALVNQNNDVYGQLLKKAKRLFGPESYIYWTVHTLLAPSDESYHQLSQFPQTISGAMRGLFKLADSNGDIGEMRRILESLNPKDKKTSWYFQACFQLAIQENDWETALNAIKKMKKVLPQTEYNKRLACCLLLTSNIKAAYRLDPENPAIVVKYANLYPKKGLVTLKKAWENNPSWPLYKTYQEQIASLDTKHQEKAIKDLVKNNPHHHFSLLALADFYLSAQEPLKAKKYLDEYMESYALTKQVALMQARIERNAWHHEKEAQEWENKSIEAEDNTLWECDTCAYKSPSWHGICPVCHTFNSLH